MVHPHHAVGGPAGTAVAGERRPGQPDHGRLNHLGPDTVRRHARRRRSGGPLRLRRLVGSVPTESTGLWMARQDRDLGRAPADAWTGPASPRLRLL